jgi:hypothetical protein
MRRWLILGLMCLGLTALRAQEAAKTMSPEEEIEVTDEEPKPPPYRSERWLVEHCVLKKDSNDTTVMQVRPQDIPKEIPFAKPKEVPAKNPPAIETIRPFCSVEKPGVCLKRRCVPMTDEERKKKLRRFYGPRWRWEKCGNVTLEDAMTQEKELKRFYGKDWKKIGDLIRSFWEVLLYAAETGDTAELVKLFSYPLMLSMGNIYLSRVWGTWTVYNAEEMKRVLAIMINDKTKKLFLQNNNCTPCIVNLQKIFIYSVYKEIEFSLKRVTYRESSRRTHVLVSKSIYFDSADFWSDLRQIERALGRKAQQNN